MQEKYKKHPKNKIQHNKQKCIIQQVKNQIISIKQNQALKQQQITKVQEQKRKKQRDHDRFLRMILQHKSSKHQKQELQKIKQNTQLEIHLRFIKSKPNKNYKFPYLFYNQFYPLQNPENLHSQLKKQSNILKHKDCTKIKKTQTNQNEKQMIKYENQENKNKMTQSQNFIKQEISLFSHKKNQIETNTFNLEKRSSDNYYTFFSNQKIMDSSIDECQQIQEDSSLEHLRNVKKYNLRSQNQSFKLQEHFSLQKLIDNYQKRQKQNQYKPKYFKQIPIISSAQKSLGLECQQLAKNEDNLQKQHKRVQIVQQKNPGLLQKLRVQRLFQRQKQLRALKSEPKLKYRNQKFLMFSRYDMILTPTHQLNITSMFQDIGSFKRIEQKQINGKSLGTSQNKQKKLKIKDKITKFVDKYIQQTDQAGISNEYDKKQLIFKKRTQTQQSEHTTNNQNNNQTTLIKQNQIIGQNNQLIQFTKNSQLPKSSDKKQIIKNKKEQTKKFLQFMIIKPNSQKSLKINEKQKLPKIKNKFIDHRIATQKISTYLNNKKIKTEPNSLEKGFKFIIGQKLKTQKKQLKIHTEVSTPIYALSPNKNLSKKNSINIQKDLSKIFSNQIFKTLYKQNNEQNSVNKYQKTSQKEKEDTQCETKNELKRMKHSKGNIKNQSLKKLKTQNSEATKLNYERSKQFQKIKTQSNSMQNQSGLTDKSNNHLKCKKMSSKDLSNSKQINLNVNVSIKNIKIKIQQSCKLKNKSKSSKNLQRKHHLIQNQISNKISKILLKDKLKY